MTCAEFQRVLPYIIDTGGNAEQEEHLRECAVCSDLVQDLKYIADQAKLLVPMEDPSPQVWDGLQKSLEREGLVKAAPARRLLLGPPARNWGWLLAVAAIVVFGIGVFLTREPSPSTQPAQVSADNTANGAISIEDEQVLQTVSRSSPDRRASYEQGLKEVNAYIADAKRIVDENPNDGDARQLLMQAYQQKAMLYQLAARSGE
jgi:hypothetical protein